MGQWTHGLAWLRRFYHPAVINSGVVEWTWRDEKWHCQLPPPGVIPPGYVLVVTGPQMHMATSTLPCEGGYVIHKANGLWARWLRWRFPYSAPV